MVHTTHPQLCVSYWGWYMQSNCGITLHLYNIISKIMLTIVKNLIYIYVYIFLINKRIINITYVNTSIRHFNNTVVILCTVYIVHWPWVQYIVSFRITEGAARPVLYNIGQTCVLHSCLWSEAVALVYVLPFTIQSSSLMYFYFLRYAVSLCNVLPTIGQYSIDISIKYSFKYRMP